MDRRAARAARRAPSCERRGCGISYPAHRDRAPHRPNARCLRSDAMRNQLVVVLLGLLSCLALSACDSRDDAHAEHEHADEHGDGSPEGEPKWSTTIPAAIAEAAGVRTETAGPATIRETLLLTGRLVPNAERTRAVSARFPGAIREVARSVGDTVRRGDRLATIESNESLETYALNAPIDGIITERHANPGENTGGEPMFVIADYGALWAELALFPRDLSRVRVGQKVTLKSVEGGLSGEGSVLRIAPTEGSAHGAVSGVYTARVSVDNADRRWAPGLFVEGAVRIGESPVPLAVKRS